MLDSIKNRHLNNNQTNMIKHMETTWTVKVWSYFIAKMLEVSSQGIKLIMISFNGILKWPLFLRIKKQNLRKQVHWDWFASYNFWENIIFVR